MSTHDHAKALNSLLKSLRGYEPTTPPDRTPLEEFIYAFLAWEATEAKADAAYRRIVNGIVDFNELRVCRPPEVIGIIGKTYPRVEERAQRLRAALNELYIREFAVSLDKCATLSKREARKYLESLDGAPSYVPARVMLLRLDGHAIPVDDKLNNRLIEAEVVDEGSDCAKTAGVLERHIKADEALRIHRILQCWADDPESEPKTIRKPAKKEEPPKPLPAAVEPKAAPKKAPTKQGAKPAKPRAAKSTRQA